MGRGRNWHLHHVQAPPREQPTTPGRRGHWPKLTDQRPFAGVARQQQPGLGEVTERCDERVITATGTSGATCDGDVHPDVAEVAAPLISCAAT